VEHLQGIVSLVHSRNPGFGIFFQLLDDDKVLLHWIEEIDTVDEISGEGKGNENKQRFVGCAAREIRTGDACLIETAPRFLRGRLVGRGAAAGGPFP